MPLDSWKAVTIDELKELVKSGKSVVEISSMFGVSYETVRRKLKRHKISMDKLDKAEIVDSLNELEVEGVNKIDASKYDKGFKDNSSRILLLNGEPSDDRCTLTISISDLHIGHSGFLPNTFNSAVKNLISVMKAISSKLKIEKLTIVLNGDIISGVSVYQNQEFDNIINKWGLQIEFGKVILAKLFEGISEVKKPDQVIFTVGNHELCKGSEYTRYLCDEFNQKYNCKFVGSSIVLDIGEPLGNYNILFTHGRGFSEYLPVPISLVKDVEKMVLVYEKNDIPIERVNLGHTHWLCTSLQIGDIIYDVNGGFQKWITFSQRPSGFVLYVFYNNGCDAIGIRPDKLIEMTEKYDPDLEIANIKLLGDILGKEYAGKNKR